MPTDYPDISFDDKGVCSYCLGSQYPVFLRDERIRELMGQKDRLKNDFEKRLEDCKGKGEYDCMVLLSGGKDSSYLAYLLTKKYKLKILTCTIENWLQSPTAKRNIREAIAKLNVDHILVTPKPEFFKKFYSYLLLFSKKEELEERGYNLTVCPVCAKVILGFALKEAARREIPMLIGGHSPDQVYIGFYEIPREEIRRSWEPPWLNSKLFVEEDRKYFWDPNNDAKQNTLPQVLFPFHVMDYPGPDKVMREVVRLGLLNKKNANPRVTNCHLSPLLHYLARRRGYEHAIVTAMSHRIRRGMSSRRKSLILLELRRLFVKLGIYRHHIKRREINLALKFLDLKVEDLI